MQPHLSTHHAKALGLPGSDVFKYSHLLYLDDLHRDHGAVSLNIEAVRAFRDTLLIAHRATLAREQEDVIAWFALGGFDSGKPYPWRTVSAARMEHINYEHLKIACGFELHLKARLLARDMIIHEIDQKENGCKNLATDQSRRPIKKAELFAVTNYKFDGQLNYLPGLKQSSLRFSWLTEKTDYAAALGLPATLLEVIDEFRQLRNQIHLPGDVLETPKINSLQRPISEVVVDFLNTEVIQWSNELILTHNMSWPILPRL